METAELLQVMGGLSVLMFIGGVLFIPWLISRLPEDYFIRHYRQVRERRRLHPVLGWSILLLRNCLGLCLLAGGLAMLVLPGQGILTILIGITIMDFPGKHGLVERFVRMDKVRRGLNWIRRRAGRQPFDFR